MRQVMGPEQTASGCATRLAAAREAASEEGQRGLNTMPSEGEPHAGEDAVRDTFSPCWMLNGAYQGKGYAFEAAQAFFDYLFSQKGARRIYAYTEDYNLASQHLCEKLGMRREGVFLEFISFVNNPDGTPRYENTVQYAILKKEWERQQSQ